MIAATAAGGIGTSRVRNLTSGASADFTSTFERVVPGTRNLRVGGAYNSAYTGEIDIAAIVYHNVVLSDAEIAKQAAFIRRYLTSRGISA